MKILFRALPILSITVLIVFVVVLPAEANTPFAMPEAGLLVQTAEGTVLAQRVAVLENEANTQTVQARVNNVAKKRCKRSKKKKGAKARKRGCKTLRTKAVSSARLADLEAAFARAQTDLTDRISLRSTAREAAVQSYATDRLNELLTAVEAEWAPETGSQSQALESWHNAESSRLSRAKAALDTYFAGLKPVGPSQAAINAVITDCKKRYSKSSQKHKLASCIDKAKHMPAMAPSINPVYDKAQRAKYAQVVAEIAVMEARYNDQVANVIPTRYAHELEAASNTLERERGELQLQSDKLGRDDNDWSDAMIRRGQNALDRLNG